MLNLGLSLSLSHTGHCKFNMAPHGKELSEDLNKKELLLYIKMALAIRGLQDPETELQHGGQDHTVV